MALLVLPDGSEAEQLISASNRLRQYDFLRDAYRLWSSGHPLELDHRFICELNFYATQYLSVAPGHYRHSIEYDVVVGAHIPPPWQEIEALMEDFVVRLKQMMADNTPPLEVSAYALWRLCWIHPFAQGNGRTARALSYFVLCQKYKVWFDGQTIPERIRATRNEYCDILSVADGTLDNNGNADLRPLVAYLDRLLTEQLSGQPSA